MRGNVIMPITCTILCEQIWWNKTHHYAVLNTGVNIKLYKMNLFMVKSHYFFYLYWTKLILIIMWSLSISKILFDFSKLKIKLSTIIYIQTDLKTKNQSN